MKPNEIIKEIKEGCGKNFVWLKSLKDGKTCGRFEDLKHSNHIILCRECQAQLKTAKQMHEADKESFIEMIDEIKEDIKLTCKLYTHKSGEELSAEIIEKIDKTLKQEVEE